MQSQAFPSHENKRVEKLLAQLAGKKDSAPSRHESGTGQHSRPQLSDAAKFGCAASGFASPLSP